MSAQLLAGIIFLFGMSCMIWLVIDGVRTGAVLGKRGAPMGWGATMKIRRDTHPLSYWGLMTLYAASALFQGWILLNVTLLGG
jgi:hypothetical protein